MITAISNNFGAGAITLKDYQKEGLVVLNGRFTFDPANEAYRNAQVLEIKVPDLSIGRSANAAIYLIDIENEMPHATLLKAWIKDCNTICIEPCRCFDERPSLDIIFCTGFVAKGVRSELALDDVIHPTVSADSGTFKLDTFTYYQQLFIKDSRWGFLALNFKNFQAAELDTEFSFMIPELPDNMDSWAVIVIGENYQSIGSPVCICHMIGQVVSCTPIAYPYNFGNDGRGCCAWFVLNDAENNV